jgi:hypothetical protein
LKKQRDENESSKFLKVLESLREDEYLYDVEVEEGDWVDVEEGALVENIMEFEGSKEDKEYMASLEAKHIVLCVHYKSFFEGSANYILQPQVRHPILKKW